MAGCHCQEIGQQQILDININSRPKRQKNLRKLNEIKWEGVTKNNKWMAAVTVVAFRQILSEIDHFIFNDFNDTQTPM